MCHCQNPKAGRAQQPREKRLPRRPGARATTVETAHNSLPVLVPESRRCAQEPGPGTGILTPAHRVQPHGRASTEEAQGGGQHTSTRPPFQELWTPPQADSFLVLQNKDDQVPELPKIPQSPTLKTNHWRKSKQRDKDFKMYTRKWLNQFNS